MATELTPAESAYWHRYLATLADQAHPVAPRVTAGFAGARDTADALLALYLAGRKSAGSSLVADFVASGDPRPEVGDFWICLDSSGRPGCILRTVRVETHRFGDVPGSVALAEGEGDCSLEHWFRVHRQAYEPSLATWGVERLEDAEVVTEFYSVVFC